MPKMRGDMKKSISTAPSADILMNSMRSIGYTFEAAIADLIDNSISASATFVDVLFPPSVNKIHLAILDDGAGMTHKELIEAMRYGSKHKNNSRDESDLGRFGLGLKSASLSQCRRLSVISKKDNKLSGFRWDLNHVELVNDWELLELEFDNEELPYLNQLDKLNSGTLVIWEDFDFLRKESDGLIYKTLSDKVDTTEQHLSLVFHRFIDGINTKVVEIRLNGRNLNAYDPFLEKHKKTDKKKPKAIIIKDELGNEHTVVAQAYILPFQQDLKDQDFKKLGGKRSLSNGQGFYIYRVNRLLVYGTWFRMQVSSDLTKYGRIKIDIPNSIDDVWKIDIKKQQAELPLVLRNNLKTVVEETGNVSRKKNTHRLLKEGGKEDQFWVRYKTRTNSFVYRFNRDSSVINQLLSELTDEGKLQFNRYLDILEHTLPYDSIYTDVANSDVDREIDLEKQSSLLATASLSIEYMIQNGTSMKDAVLKITSIDPFSKDVIRSLILREWDDEK
jgi:hypothetical protein